MNNPHPPGMTVEALTALFESPELESEFLRFERVSQKLSSRPDVHAFLLLDQLIPGSDCDMVAAAEHDEIFLAPEPEELAMVATPEIVIELHRCGVRYDVETNSLAMFV